MSSNGSYVDIINKVDGEMDQNEPITSTEDELMEVVDVIVTDRLRMHEQQNEEQIINEQGTETELIESTTTSQPLVSSSLPPPSPFQEDELTIISDPVEFPEEEVQEREEEDEIEELRVLKKCLSCNWFHILYLFDWMIAIFVLVIIGVLLGNILVKPHKRYLPETWINETRWNYPLVDDIVPGYLLVVVVLTPFLVVGCAQICYTVILKSCLDFHHGILGYVVAFSFMYSFVNFTKLLAGSYRPNYKEYCEAKSSIEDCEIETPNGAMSFPSGHASTIFTTTLYTSLYLSGKLRVFAERGASLWKYVVVSLPLALGIFVSVSRTWDYYHRFEDVTAGAIEGMIAAVSAYLLYYHSPLSKECDLPKDRYKGLCGKTGSEKKRKYFVKIITAILT